MAEEKDANELEAEKDIALGALPPIPVQLPTSSGTTRVTQRLPGSWLKENGIVPPPGSVPGLDLDFGDGKPKKAASRGNVAVVEDKPAKRTPAKKAAPRKKTDGS
jgi:hypothetical protein